MITVSQNGMPLSSDKFVWDKRTGIFSTNENGLVIDATGENCYTFITGSGCSFKTGSSCTFKTGKNCVAIRFDVDGIIEIPSDKTIKLNGYSISGYTIVEKPKSTCNGKVVEIEGVKYKLVEQ